MSDVADLLDNAADLLERDGWCQWEGQVGAAHCVGNALWAGITTNMQLPHMCFAARHLYDVIGCNSYVLWNDTPGRTKQEVLDALRLAAKNARIADEAGA